MPWLGTFHSICARMLRRHAELVGLQANYTIIDTDDQLRLLKQLIADSDLDEKRWPARQLAALIDRWKNRGLNPADLDSVENEATVMVSSSPLVVMTTRSAVQIKGGGDCGVLRANDIASASFLLEGRPAAPDRTAALRTSMLNTMRPMIGHEICVFYRPQGEAFLATSTVDSRPRPEMDQKVLWVSPADGWKVGF